MYKDLRASNLEPREYVKVAPDKDAFIYIEYIMTNVSTAIAVTVPINESHLPDIMTLKFSALHKYSERSSSFMASACFSKATLNKRTSADLFAIFPAVVFQINYRQRKWRAVLQI